MRILALSGSPRSNGNSRLLLQAFGEGAEAAGHQLSLFDAAKLKIGPCLACDHCRQETSLGICAQKDDMQQIYEAWPQADALVLASPLYYFGFAAQIKLAIDRFYAIPGQKEPAKRLQKLALLAACGDAEEEAMTGLVGNYRLICNYWDLPSAGEILAIGVHEKGAIKNHPSLAQARELGAKFGSA